MLSYHIGVFPRTLSIRFFSFSSSFLVVVVVVSGDKEEWGIVAGEHVCVEEHFHISVLFLANDITQNLPQDRLRMILDFSSCLASILFLLNGIKYMTPYFVQFSAFLAANVHALMFSASINQNYI